MDRSGAMPRSAWVEIRDEAGALLTSIPAWIDGGTVTAGLPSFAPRTMGTIQLCTDQDEAIDRELPELEELPTGPQLMLVEMG